MADKFLNLLGKLSLGGTKRWLKPYEVEDEILRNWKVEYITDQEAAKSDAS